MSSKNASIIVSNLNKRYHLYNSPRDRLKQFVAPMLGMKRTYFKEHWALKDINFEVLKGESVGIIGRNGSGKSTLLQIISGTLTPTSGEVEVHGKVAALLELGSGFNPDFTGRENVYLNGSILGLSPSQIDEKFDAIAGFADIGDYLDQPVKTYSSGMLVRLAFAVQVQVEPDILIVDEALAVGDALFQKRCFKRIEALRNNGVTILFVSHDQESVRTLTQRAVLLSKGQMLDFGASADVILKYRKQLHQEESAYFKQLSKEVSGGLEGRDQYGDGDVVVDSVEIFNDEGQVCHDFKPQQNIRMRVHCTAKVDSERLNVNIRIRNKEGVKIYSWGTLNQDMMASDKTSAEVFWNRRFKAEESFFVDFMFVCALGANFYEVQAAVTEEEEPRYFSQRMLHWKDEAAFFRVSVESDRYFFGGIADLAMKANW